MQHATLQPTNHRFVLSRPTASLYFLDTFSIDHTQNKRRERERTILWRASHRDTSCPGSRPRHLSSVLNPTPLHTPQHPLPPTNTNA